MVFEDVCFRFNVGWTPDALDVFYMSGRRWFLGERR
jgi:hypothetical protein